MQAFEWDKTDVDCTITVQNIGKEMFTKYSNKY